MLSERAMVPCAKLRHASDGSVGPLLALFCDSSVISVDSSDLGYYDLISVVTSYAARAPATGNTFYRPKNY